MRRYLLPLAILAGVLLFVTAACGGDSGPDAPPTAAATPTPDVRIVTSDDGKLTLAIPLGAVSDDQEITITAVPLAELPDPLPNVRGAALADAPAGRAGCHIAADGHIAGIVQRLAEHQL